jgi:DNA polymerase III epsilon subunit-like protein
VTLDDIHQILRQLLHPTTILVGHSLNTDLRVLHLLHHRIIDTAALYEHANGSPYKHSLKKLAKLVLGKDIQGDVKGHDSVQDALIALELALVRAGSQQQQVLEGEELSKRYYYQQPKYTLFEYLCRSATVGAVTSSSGKHDQQLHVEVFYHPIQPDRWSSWEAHAFGYGLEHSAQHALQRFVDKVRDCVDGESLQNGLASVSHLPFLGPCVYG